MKLLIADDHTLFRDALVQYIERSDPLASVSLAKDLYQALDILEQNSYYDLVLLDLRMPGMNGMGGFKIIKERFPDTLVALMSGIAEPEDVQAAIDLGAVGYFPKTMSAKALLGGIKQVVAGEKFILKSKKTDLFMPSYYSDKKPAVKEIKPPIVSKINDLKFTPREKEVLGFLVDGASNKDIARALDLQIVTVKLHVRGIFRKLGAKNRTQAALKAKDMGVTPAS